MAPGSEDRYDIGNDDIKRHIITGFHGAAVDVLSLTTLSQMHVTLQNKKPAKHINVRIFLQVVDGFMLHFDVS